MTSVVDFSGEKDEICAQKSALELFFFNLTSIDLQIGFQKVLESDFQGQFSISKIIRISFFIQ